ncbi:MAG: hypothetical protein JSS42_06370, partial [Proteobacteria bacterium]|nr:hypothetical protein [Pseudomonadota bacterium]
MPAFTHAMTESGSTLHRPASSSALTRLRRLVPLAFLVLTGWLLWREVGTQFDLPEVQRTLLDVPTVAALAIALL